MASHEATGEVAPAGPGSETPANENSPEAIAATAAAPLARIGGDESIDRAAGLIIEGKPVAIATETVYGLAADASNPEAIERVYKIKGRPKKHPVIVHIANADSLQAWAAEVPEAARKLATAFWPGPLTLVLKRSPAVPDAVTGGADTVALRSPSHPIAQALLARLAELAPDRPVGLAAPSANRYGKVSPTTAAHVLADVGADIELILDGGPCTVGIESTIVDVSGEQPAILRPGGIAAADIEKVLGDALATPDAASPVVPGSTPAHYAPRAKLQLATRRQIIDALATNRGRRIAVLALEVAVPRLAPSLMVVVPVIAAQYARSLYANLRALDAAGADLILVEMPPETPNWSGVLDRLRRAATAPPKKRERRGEEAPAEPEEG